MFASEYSTSSLHRNLILQEGTINIPSIHKSLAGNHQASWRSEISCRVFKVPKPVQIKHGNEDSKVLTGVSSKEGSDDKKW